jgi:TIR domain
MDFEEQIVEQIKSQLHEKVSAIVDPKTGERAVLVTSGSTLQELKMRVEGSEELLTLVKERLGDDAEQMQWGGAKPPVPKVFVSYTSKDETLAQLIAERFCANGIDAWWAEWEIRPGQSLRQRIDEGLGNCSHFVVLLTPNSINRPWVKAEMDAAFVRRLNDACVFIPLRSDLSPGDLPPTLQALNSPHISRNGEGLDQLINDIHGVSRKPAVGPQPPAIRLAKDSETGYSPSATVIAQTFVEQSKHGDFGDPQFSVDDLVALGLTHDDVIDGIHELNEYLSESFGSVWPKADLFAEFDKYWKPWDPAKDALQLMTSMVNDEDFPAAMDLIGQRLQWEPRRLNAAVTYIKRRRLANVRDGIGGMPFVAFQIVRTDDTRRFVKSRHQLEHY